MARRAAAVKSTTEPRAKRVRFATVAECKATRPGVPSLRLAPRTYLQCDARGNKSGILVYMSPVTKKRRSLGLGSYGAVGSLATILAKADEANRAVDAGRHPIDEKVRTAEAGRAEKVAGNLAASRMGRDYPNARESRARVDAIRLPQQEAPCAMAHVHRRQLGHEGKAHWQGGTAGRANLIRRCATCVPTPSST